MLKASFKILCNLFPSYPFLFPKQIRCGHKQYDLNNRIVKTGTEKVKH